ncbi:MAG: type II toxin-antitoxin system HicA family toxin [Candidatus Altiarchaeota archaeon]|nr:type II toxin-antitoxin system HicA family toxin [Candidatus Altiarchaeota archaeon]
MKLTPIRPQRLEKLLFNLGFAPIRQRGSHVFYKHKDGRTTSIPFHGGEDVGPVLLGKILREIELEREEYFRFLRKR